jgi:hypothetical protein
VQGPICHGRAGRDRTQRHAVERDETYDSGLSGARGGEEVRLQGGCSGYDRHGAGHGRFRAHAERRKRRKRRPSERDADAKRGGHPEALCGCDGSGAFSTRGDAGRIEKKWDGLLPLDWQYIKARIGKTVDEIKQVTALFDQQINAFILSDMYPAFL